MRIKLTNKKNSVVFIKSGKHLLRVEYGRTGYLKRMIVVKNKKQKSSLDMNFLVEDFNEGKSTFKTTAGMSGFFSIQGTVHWGTVWDDIGPNMIKKCSFQSWVNECARVLLGKQKAISSRKLFVSYTKF